MLKAPCIQEIREDRTDRGKAEEPRYQRRLCLERMNEAGSITYEYGSNKCKDECVYGNSIGAVLCKSVAAEDGIEGIEYARSDP